MSNADPRSPVEIVVCVHNGLEDVRKCLTSLMATMRDHDRLVIVDDGSGTETMHFCQTVFHELGIEKCILLRRPEGSGFCKAANAGLKATSCETVIILNSDTIVVGDWITRITACMSANWRIGIVGPMSNAGGWQSIPELPTATVSSNRVRSDLATLEEIHEQCARFAGNLCPPIVEQINGFCFGVSRDVLNRIGLFDEVNFPMGYGEENDFTFRAMNAGFLCAVALDCC
ncbi:glycosyltransferase family 2 protein [Yoonia vestfoldensis]|uniref:glycosyltransferase family 2 protein n=1 Tax=Yoonia vestfoldensis TaxID=245188 RepID=UPI00036DBA1F|nr:glycosyltransferase family 2 protein [Yoonia vestfoldensis]